MTLLDIKCCDVFQLLVNSRRPPHPGPAPHRRNAALPMTGGKGIPILLRALSNERAPLPVGAAEAHQFCDIRDLLEFRYYRYELFRLRLGQNGCCVGAELRNEFITSQRSLMISFRHRNEVRELTPIVGMNEYPYLVALQIPS